MPLFKYSGTEARTFPDLNLEVNPGDVVEFDENPNGTWFYENPDLTALKKDELADLAAQHDIEVPASATKQELVDILTKEL